MLNQLIMKPELYKINNEHFSTIQPKLPIFCYDDEVFTDSEIKDVLDYCESLEMHEALVYNTDKTLELNSTSRISKISWVEINEKSKWFIDKVVASVNKINEEYYRFDINSMEKPQYTLYDTVGSNYGTHMDCLTNNHHSTMRKLSCTLLLNDSTEFYGGEFKFTVCGGLDEVVNLKRGRLIVFPSFFLHSVSPIEKGSRKSLVFWFNGPIFK